MTLDARLRWGLQPITYGLDWAESLQTVAAIDGHRFDYLWGHDHLWSTGGDTRQPFFEGWTMLSAWAALTEHVRLGILVAANPFRNPGVVAKMAATLDHVSGGRFVLGMGAGNREDEAIAHGIDPGRSVGQRLDWLDESLTIVRAILDGEDVTHESERYRFDGAYQAPRPLQSRMPIIIGASGEIKGLRIVAQHADLWHQWLSPHEAAVFRHKSAVLDEHLDRAGRPRDAIERHVGGRLVIRDSAAEAERFFAEQMRVHGWDERMVSFTWAGTPEQLIEWIGEFHSLGMSGFSPSVAAPLDLETIERLATQVRPQFDLIAAATT